VRFAPEAEPQRLLLAIGETMSELLTRQSDEGAELDLALARLDQEGRMSHAGPPWTLLVCRTASEGCETPAFPDGLRLLPGDLLVLCTERLVADERFGLDRLAAEVARIRSHPVKAIHDHLVYTASRLSGVAEDDITLLVGRFTGPARPLN